MSSNRPIAVQDVKAKIVDGKLTLSLGATKKRLSFNPKNIDPAAAQALVKRLEKMKALASGSSD